MKRKASETQGEIDLLADYCWQCLHDVFGLPSGKRPPCFLFLSPESAGSLSQRRPDEKDFVRLQQALGGGACLEQPPLAYVSDSSQVPEEVAHLFVTRFQRKPRRELDLEVAFYSMLLHEFFAHFGELMVFGLKQKTKRMSRRRIQTPEHLWSVTHCEAYFLGDKAAKMFFKGQITALRLRKLLQSSWYQKSSAKRLTHRLYRLLELEARDYLFPED